MQFNLQLLFSQLNVFGDFASGLVLKQQLVLVIQLLGPTISINLSGRLLFSLCLALIDQSASDIPRPFFVITQALFFYFRKYLWFVRVRHLPFLSFF